VADTVLVRPPRADVVERDDTSLTPLPAQNRLINAIMQLKEIPYFFFVAGYGSGKSFCIVLLLLLLVKMYEGKHIKILLGGTTLGDVQKFILQDLFKILIVNKIKYKHNKKDNILNIGTTTIFCVPTEDASRIYGHTVDIALIDEIDELKKNVAEAVFKAIVERTRATNLGDREPFMAYFTTTQGKKRAVYEKLRKLKSDNINYCLVRGSTRENKHNSASYLKNLLNIYSKEEQKAYLDGFFMDLSSGRVYGDFNEEKMVIEPFPITQDEVIHVGQDKNIGYNKAVCIVKRNGILYTVREFSTTAIQDVPRIVRQAYPTNRIIWYPDASALELLGGYAAEISKWHIELSVMKFNPSILSRIFIVNKLYKTGKSFVFKTCKELIDAHDGRSYDDSGKPEKVGGEKCPSHICDADEYVKWNLVINGEEFADIRSLISTIKG
jgi:hypothetical protein